MSKPCRARCSSTPEEREFCRALLNHEISVWDDRDPTVKRYRRGFRLPPDDFTYGIKHPQQAGVAEALQHDDDLNQRCAQLKLSKTGVIPNFIALNKTVARLGLSKVRDIHHYRKAVQNSSSANPPCADRPVDRSSLHEITYGRPTGEQQSMRDLIENRYLYEWLEQRAVQRCREIFKSENVVRQNCTMKPVKQKKKNRKTLSN